LARCLSKWVLVERVVSARTHSQRIVRGDRATILYFLVLRRWVVVEVCLMAHLPARPTRTVAPAAAVLAQQQGVAELQDRATREAMGAALTMRLVLAVVVEVRALLGKTLLSARTAMVAMARKVLSQGPPWFTRVVVAAVLSTQQLLAAREVLVAAEMEVLVLSRGLTGLAVAAVVPAELLLPQATAATAL